MSALLANASATFSYQGASVTLTCSSPAELKNALATFGIGQAANDATAAPGKSAKAATAPAGPSASPTAAPSAPAAAAPAAGDAGNASASTSTPASAPAAASGSAPAGEQGNGASTAAAPAGSSQAQAPAPAASVGEAVSFDDLKKAFLALPTKAGGREKCEAVLKPFNLPKLSAASPEQYAAVMAEIKKQAGE